MRNCGRSCPDLVRIFHGKTVSGLSEWQLLARYVEERDEIAFESLVARHAPVVLGVCRRMLGDSADVEDAFQATFLVLVRRARQLGPGDAIGPWLHGVAVRVALRARSDANRRRCVALETEPVAIPDDSMPQRELARVLDQELERLPAKYRFPLVLCYLDGQTHEEAARQLGWPVGTVKGRLARGRDLLRSRLNRRGVSPSATIALVSIGHESNSLTSSELLARTVRTSLDLASGSLQSRSVSSLTTSLAQGILTAMLVQKLKTSALISLVAASTLAGAVVVARQQNTPASPEAASGIPVPSKDVAKISILPFAGDAPASEFIGTDARSRLILEKLEEPISMPFANETPLEDVLKYIRTATTTEKFVGLPIYLDEKGLAEAEKTATSPVKINLEGIPLRRSLQLILAQLNLRYFVVDGMIYITGDSDQVQLPPMGSAVHEPSPISQRLAKAERGELPLEEMKDLLEIVKCRDQIRAVADTARARHEAMRAGGSGGALTTPTVEPKSKK